MAASAANKTKLQEPWNPTSPIDEMWTNIHECRQIAALNNNPISDIDTINAVLDKMTKTGLFALPLELWNTKTDNDQTFDNLVLHFDHADRARRTAMTTVQAGYMALQPMQEPSAPIPTTAPTANLAAAPAPRPALTNRTNTQATKQAPRASGYHYCHTHGINKTHDSTQCSYPAAGHITDATFADMKGGNTTVFKTRPRPIKK
jgi:hypothetical protein